MEDCSLSQLVAAYRNNELSFEDIEEKLSLFVYEYPRKYRRWDLDLCSEFFEFFNPRIRLAADRFVDRGIPFESYLGSLVFFQMKTFLLRKREARERENVVLVADYHDNKGLYDGRGQGTGPLFAGELNVSYHGKIRKKKGKKRVFYMAMTNPERLDEGDIRKLAEFTGYRADYIRNCRDALNGKLAEKKEKAASLLERRNAVYCRYLVLQDRLRREVEPAARELLEKRLEKARYKIERISRKLAVKNIRITHRDIADVLNIPKGTVDSSLYYLKRTLE